MSEPIEFSRRFHLNRLGQGGEQLVTASRQECDALAHRLKIPAIAELSGRFLLHPVVERGTVRYVQATGTLVARVTQICAITAEPFEDLLSETFRLRFVPQDELPDDTPGEDGYDVDVDSLDLDRPDDFPHDGKALDLGEATAQQLALLLDPYPRKPGGGLDMAVDVPPSESERDDVMESKPHPFAVLSTLKKPDNLD